MEEAKSWGRKYWGERSKSQEMVFTSSIGYWIYRALWSTIMIGPIETAAMMVI
jgi:hypothetical protein